jgi:flagellar basal-body rod protein FlgG
MVPRMKAQEVIANNLANVSTAGFKRDRVFDVSLSKAQAKLVQTTTDWQGTQSIGISVDHSPGPLEQTGNPLHMAIDGDGFFTISTPEGERYTRNGNFTVSADGVLVTSDGNPLMGWAGDIQISPGLLEISDDGNVSVDGLNVGQLLIVRFDDPGVLVKSSSSLFSLGDAFVQPANDSESVIRQGFLERSNVSSIEELVDMIVAMRIYESDQKAIQVQDDTLGRAVNDLGRVRG